MTKQSDILITNLVSLREKVELQEMIGLLLGYTFVHAEIADDESLLNFAKQIQSKFLNSYQTQTSADLLVLSEPQWQKKFINGLCQFVFNFVDFEMKPPQFVGTSVEEIVMPEFSDGDDYEIYFEIVKVSGGYQCYLHYFCDLYTDARAEQMLNGYLEIMSNFLKQPEQTVKELLEPSGMSGLIRSKVS